MDSRLSTTPSSGSEAGQPVPGRRLIPVQDWPKHHPWPPLGGLRHLVRHRQTNGFASVVRHVGGRVLIDEAAFFAWVDGAGSSAAKDVDAGDADVR